MKNARRRSRELVTQMLYQWLLSGAPAEEIDAQLRSSQDYEKADRQHLNAILHGVIRNSEMLSTDIAQYLDRPLAQLSPIERVVLFIATYELKYYIDIPYRVIINEAVELTKTFGSLDGYKYINGVLDKLAMQLRLAETHATCQR